MCALTAIIGVVLAVALTPFAAVSGPFEDAVDASESGDYATAVRLYRLAAEQGDTVAQYNLGTMYQLGQGVPLDYTEAGKWYRLAAEQGLAEAQYNLGVMYRDGQGVPQDYVEAAKWSRLAAAQGYASAQYNLGFMYEEGQGVPQDYAGAMKWYQLAAAQGHDAALFNLGSMYGLGNGVPQDYVLAHMWFNLAASRFPSGEGHDRAVQARDGFAGLMTPAQLAEAQRLAREWRPTTKRPAETNAEPASRGLRKISTGTGFIVDQKGRVLTNHHVVDGCAELRLGSGDDTVSVQLLASDPSNDLALVEGARPGTNVAAFRSGRGVRPGDSVVAVGFPLQDILASKVIVTTGAVSALAGPGDDHRLLQITAPVQPGSSGGPLLDMSGAVVGVIVSKLDAVAVAKVTGDIPQNVNFAINAAVARLFLDAQGVTYELRSADAGTMTPADVAEQATRFTLLVECWR